MAPRPITQEEMNHWADLDDLLRAGLASMDAWVAFKTLLPGLTLEQVAMRRRFLRGPLMLRSPQGGRAALPRRRGR